MVGLAASPDAVVAFANSHLPLKTQGHGLLHKRAGVALPVWYHGE